MLHQNVLKRTLKLNRILNLLPECRCKSNVSTIRLEKLIPIYLNSVISKINLVQNIVSSRRNPNCITVRTYAAEEFESVDSITFETFCNETLDSLCEYFDDLVEKYPIFKSADVTFSDGVLTVNLGSNFGTYVINRQTPNKQIWLSSPTSGPKRYDYLVNRRCWVYRHDNVSLHRLLEKEISAIINEPIDLSQCAHCEQNN